MAYFELSRGFCRNCEEVRSIGVINGQYPEFPILCKKCGFKSTHRFPENFLQGAQDKSKSLDKKNGKE
jgi:hypothetical protein